MATTLKDVAQSIGVSVQTASDILNSGDTRYSEETRRKVQEAAQRLNYRPNRQARILRGAKSGLIGMLKPVSVIQTNSERDLYAAEAIRQAGGYDLIAFDVHWHQQGLERAVDFLLTNRVEGVILASLDGAHPTIGETLRRLKASGIPLVSMGGTVVPGILWIGTDYFHGGQLLAHHLLSLGSRSAAFLTDQEHYSRFSSVTRRLAGLESVFREAGGCVETILGVAPEKTDESVSLRNFTSGHPAFKEFLARKTAFDAAVCSNDYTALAVIRACWEAGIRTPHDLAVTGFDDAALSRFSIPQITTVAQPIREVAEKAVEILLQAIKGKPHPTDTPIELPCKLIVRESCGAQIAPMSLT